MRFPRRAAAALSAVALTGALTACSNGDTADEPAVDNEAPIGDPAVPGGEAETDTEAD